MQLHEIYWYVIILDILVCNYMKYIVCNDMKYIGMQLFEMY